MMAVKVEFHDHGDRCSVSMTPSGGKYKDQNDQFLLEILSEFFYGKEVAGRIFNAEGA